MKFGDSTRWFIAGTICAAAGCGARSDLLPSPDDEQPPEAQPDSPPPQEPDPSTPPIKEPPPCEIALQGAPGSIRPHTVTRVSVSSSGEQGQGHSFSAPTISADGTRIAFMSESDNLVSGDDNDTRDIFLWDVATGTTTRVSLDNDDQEFKGASNTPSLSADGNIIAFSTHREPAYQSGTDVFIRDVALGATTLVNQDLSQTGAFSVAQSISGDGNLVAFQRLVLGEYTAESAELLVANRQEDTIFPISVDALDPNETTSSWAASFSADGKRVAFTSQYMDLDAGWDHVRGRIFVRDLMLGTTTLMSVNSEGAEADEQAHYPSLSGDGSSLVFQSSATNLTSSPYTRAFHIFLRRGGSTSLVSVNSSGTEGNDSSYQASISDDGRFVAFMSLASNLVPCDENGAADIFLADLEQGMTVRLSVNASGTEGNGGSRYPAISDDGRFVTFMSEASNLVDDDTNGVADIFVVPSPF